MQGNIFAFKEFNKCGTWILVKERIQLLLARTMAGIVRLTFLTFIFY